MLGRLSFVVTEKHLGAAVNYSHLEKLNMRALIPFPCRTGKVQLAHLPERYNTPLTDIFGLLFQLRIAPYEIDGTLYISETQLQHLDLFYLDCKVEKRVFLYQCSFCGDLWVLDAPHMYEAASCTCKRSQEQQDTRFGTFDFVGSGTEEEIIALAQSIMLGLLDPMKGI